MVSLIAPLGEPAYRAQRKHGAGWQPILETRASGRRDPSSRCSASARAS